MPAAPVMLMPIGARLIVESVTQMWWLARRITKPAYAGACTVTCETCTCAACWKSKLLVSTGGFAGSAAVTTMGAALVPTDVIVVTPLHVPGETSTSLPAGSEAQGTAIMLATRVAPAGSVADPTT